MGRRMCETAGLLVDHRLPAVPYRQWVLSFPGPMAVRLGYDTKLLAAVCRSLTRRVTQSMRRKMQAQLASEAQPMVRRSDLHAGVLVVVQRFRNDLGLFVHLHCLVTDGCFVDEEGGPRFVQLRALDNADLLGVLGKVFEDLQAQFEDCEDVADEGVLACLQLAARERPQRQLQLVEGSGEPPPVKPLTVSGFGMQLHAATTVDGGDKAALERICRYLLRPPFAQDAIEALDDGRVRVHFKAPTRGGQTHVDILRETFVARLAALVPPPRFNLVRYYGVFASQHRLRKAVAPKTKDRSVKQLKLFQLRPWLEGRRLSEVSFVQQPGAVQAAKPPGRIGWSTLLARVFKLDVTKCGACGGRLRVVETVTSHKRLRELGALGDGARGPPGGRPAVVGQLEFCF